MDYRIEPVGALNVQDFLDLFDNRAFSDNPDWEGCYCVFNQFGGSGEEWRSRTAAKTCGCGAQMRKSLNGADL